VGGLGGGGVCLEAVELIDELNILGSK